MPLIEEAIVMAKKRTIRELENSGRIGKIEGGGILLDVDLTVSEEGPFAGASAVHLEGLQITLEEGKLYTVTSDRGACTCECIRQDEMYGLAGYFDGDPTNDFGHTFVIAVQYDSGNEYWFADVVDFGGATHITVKTPETIRKIDPKFIPTIDTMILMGADGKQYRLSVNDTGALVATPIE